MLVFVSHICIVHHGVLHISLVSLNALNSQYFDSLYLISHQFPTNKH